MLLIFPFPLIFINPISYNGSIFSPLFHFFMIVRVTWHSIRYYHADCMQDVLSLELKAHIKRKYALESLLYNITENMKYRLSYDEPK